VNRGNRELQYCLHQDCLDSNGRPIRHFTRKADVARHHKSTYERTFMDCPKHNCRRKGVNGFTRQDHLTEHLRGYHGEDIAKRRSNRARARVDEQTHERPFLDHPRSNCNREGINDFKRTDHQIEHLWDCHGAGITKRSDTQTKSRVDEPTHKKLFTDCSKSNDAEDFMTYVDRITVAGLEAETETRRAQRWIKRDAKKTVLEEAEEANRLQWGKKAREKLKREKTKGKAKKVKKRVPARKEHKVEEQIEGEKRAERIKALREPEPNSEVKGRKERRSSRTELEAGQTASKKPWSIYIKNMWSAFRGWCDMY
jgi:hypothetical protein